MKSGTHIFTIASCVSVTVVVSRVKWWLWNGACAVLWRWISILTDFMLPTVPNRKQPIWQQKFEQTWNIRWNCVLIRLPNLNLRVCIFHKGLRRRIHIHIWIDACRTNAAWNLKLNHHWVRTTQRKKCRDSTMPLNYRNYMSLGAIFEAWFIETCCINTKFSTKVRLFVSNSPFRYLII